jgi:hypothetical protein
VFESTAREVATMVNTTGQVFAFTAGFEQNPDKFVG